MTREEAKKIIDCYDINFYDLSGEKIPADKLAEAFDMATEALSEPRGDLISREDAIDAICKSWCYVTYMDCPHADDGFRCDGCDDIEAIEALPSAENSNQETQKSNGDLIYKGINDKLRSLPSAEAEWIPVTKDGCNFPPYSEFVLVWVNDGHEIASYEYDPKAGADFWSMDAYELYGENIWRVKAWMPLPKPYREDGEEE